jgi:hypothetical protein
MMMAAGFLDPEWLAFTGIAPGALMGLAVLMVAAGIAGWACLRRISRLNAWNFALDERLRLAKDHEEQAIRKLTIAEARFQELYARIKSSDGFVSLASSAGVVSRSIADLGKAHNQLSATLSTE